jgi:hypothetical protein
MAEDVLIARFRIDSSGAVSGAIEGTDAIAKLKKGTTEAAETTEKATQSYDRLGHAIAKAFKVGTIAAFVVNAVRQSEILSTSIQTVFRSIGATFDGFLQGIFGTTDKLTDRLARSMQQFILSPANFGSKLEEAGKVIDDYRDRWHRLGEDLSFLSAKIPDYIQAIADAHDSAFKSSMSRTEAAILEQSGMTIKQFDQLSEIMGMTRESTTQFIKEMSEAANTSVRDTILLYGHLEFETAPKAVQAQMEITRAISKLVEQRMQMAKNESANMGKQWISMAQVAQSVGSFIGNVFMAIGKQGSISSKQMTAMFLDAFGTLAMGAGMTLIGIGLGVEALKTLAGAAAVVAGIGLVAIGGLLKGFAAKSGESGGGMGGFEGGGFGGAGGGGFTGIGGAPVGGPIEPQQPNVTVNFEVKGLNMVDRSEVNGLVQTYIVPAIREIVQENNVRVVQTGF